jgi:hypothetical protein
MKIALENGFLANNSKEKVKLSATINATIARKTGSLLFQESNLNRAVSNVKDNSMLHIYGRMILEERKKRKH